MYGHGEPKVVLPKVGAGVPNTFPGVDGVVVVAAIGRFDGELKFSKWNIKKKKIEGHVPKGLGAVVDGVVKLPNAVGAVPVAGCVPKAGAFDQVC